MFRSTVHSIATHTAAEVAAARRPGAAELLVIGTGFDSGKELTFYQQRFWLRLRGFSRHAARNRDNSPARDIILVKNSEPVVKTLSASAAGK